MHTFKKILFAVSFIAVSLLGWVAGAASDTIIDSSLMNNGVLAEPIFGNPIPEVSHHGGRGPASVDASASVKPNDKKKAKLNKSPAQYLDVQKDIPFSEPSLTKAGLERAILNNGD